MLSEKFLLTAIMTTFLAGCQAQQQQPKRELPDEQTGWIKFIPSYEPVYPQDCCQPTSQTRPPRAQSSNVPAAVPFTSQQQVASLKDFVYGQERNAQISTAVRKIVPLSWGVVVEPDVVKNYKAKVSWEGNDQWPIVLRKMLTGTGLDADINDTKKHVIIKYSKQAVAPVTLEPIAPVKKELTSLHPPLVPAVTLAPALTTPTASKPPFTPTTISPVPAAPAPQTKTWKIDVNSSLRKAFEALAVKETCQTGNRKWRVNWETETDYAIEEPLTFTSANFENMTHQLFELYSNAKVPLKVDGYSQQCVIFVVDKK